MSVPNGQFCAGSSYWASGAGEGPRDVPRAQLNIGDGLKNQAPAGDDELDGDGAAGGRDATGGIPRHGPA